MKEFEQFINEQAEGNKEDLNKIASEVEKSFKKYFPNGWIDVKVAKILKDDLIHISLGLIGDTNLLTGKYKDNDPMHHKFMVTPEPKGYQAKQLSGQLYLKKPKAGSFMAMERVKTNFRKATGDVNKVVKTFDSFFDKLKKIVKDNQAEIYNREKYPDKFFQ